MAERCRERNAEHLTTDNITRTIARISVRYLSRLAVLKGARLCPAFFQFPQFTLEASQRLRKYRTLRTSSYRPMGTFQQSCSLGLDVSVSRRIFQTSRSRQSVGRSRSRLGLKVKRLGLGPQRLVYKWTFKQIFQFLSFSYKTNMSDICFSYIVASSFTCFRFVKIALKRSKILVCTLSNDNKVSGSLMGHGLNGSTNRDG